MSVDFDNPIDTSPLRRPDPGLEHPEPRNGTVIYDNRTDYIMSEVQDALDLMSAHVDATILIEADKGPLGPQFAVAVCYQKLAIHRLRKSLEKSPSLVLYSIKTKAEPSRAPAESITFPVTAQPQKKPRNTSGSPANSTSSSKNPPALSIDNGSFLSNSSITNGYFHD